MAKVYKGIQELIGNTPLVEAVNLEKKLGLKATLLLKLEYFNPAGSVKDRIANGMIEDAEKKGLLKEGATIIEPTSGNTEWFSSICSRKRITKLSLLCQRQ